LQGEFGAYLRAFIKIELSLGFFKLTIVDAQFELARIKLLSFSVPPRGEVASDELAVVDAGTLRLNLRDGQDDNFRVSQDASGGVVIAARGQTKRYGGSFSKIVGSSGAGNDSIVFDETVTYPVEIQGGSGNDTLNYKGTSTANLQGNEGDDTLYGSNGDDSMDGGVGKDKLFGGSAMI